MSEMYQIHVETIISEFRRKKNVELTDYLIDCIEKCLEDSYKYTNLCN